LELHQLIPEDRRVETAELLGGMDLAGRAPDDRPYIAVNFISSADGRAAFQGRSGPLGDQADREIFHGLREQVDAVMAGTRTLETEHYGRVLGKAERRERRVAAGRKAEPLMCLVSRSGSIPVQAPIFSEPEARIVVFAPPGTAIDGAAAQVQLVELDPGEMTLTTAMRSLRAEFEVRSLLCEGGPTLFGALLEERLVDELFLTLAPKLTGGGTSPTVSTGPELAELAPLALVWALEHDDSLFLRYRVG
jgi:5-amino-6-(5-phosphoribosylamino)uracil reductase